MLVKPGIPYDAIFSNDFIAVCPLAVVMLKIEQNCGAMLSRHEMCYKA